MPRLAAIVLGSAAGGGIPQWNCACSVCRLAWAGDRRVKPRTQASLAVSGNRKDWILLNASPDLRAQIAATPRLQPKAAAKKNTRRSSPIAAVVLTGAEIDQIGGLLHLRERQPFQVFGTKPTLEILRANPVFSALADDVVARRSVRDGESFKLPGGVEAELFKVSGKVPLYLEGENPEIGGENETTVGVEIRANGARLVFIPGAAAVTPAIMERAAKADALFFDATLYRDDEMIRAKTGSKTGLRMGHMPISGNEGSLKVLSGLAKRCFYIHINNTNPIVVKGSPEQKRVTAAGFRIAEDGMEISL
jgi:pyrroloquinoline quinone biosynthesis protein B